MEPDARQMARMLLWFKSHLPPHELGRWRFELQGPTAEVLNEDTEVTYASRDGWSLLIGGAYCLRCRRHFPLPRYGNFRVWEDSESRPVGAVIAEAKEWLQRDAANAGECWGDVPDLRDDGGFAVADVREQLGT